MTRGVFIGRFQPLHYGHSAAIKFSLEHSDELIIVIGSAQKNHELDNPFTTGERYEMLIRYLKSERVTKPIYIAPLDDIENHSLWVSHLRSYLPPFDVIFSNNRLVRLLAEEAGIRVVPVPFYRREELMATKIREKILKDEPWQDLVPPPVYEYIKQIGGDARIKEIARAREDIHESSG
ncbi:MAG: nicotinamide-nucleotide adenylyltransferase [Nitrososphaeria archaeon]|jgi:nicotinamide-nucleotide adenylyltransferase